MQIINVQMIDKPLTILHSKMRIKNFIDQINAIKSYCKWIDCHPATYENR